MTTGAGDVAPQGTSSDSEPRDIRWHKVIPAAELEPRALRKVSVAGRVVLLARSENGFLQATSAVCPHQAADLSKGNVYMGAIECPRHRYLYDLRTGQNRYPREVFPADLAATLDPLPLFPVREKSGWIWVGEQLR